MDLPRVGIGIMITMDGKVLLGKRKAPLGNATWTMPGGKLEMNEMPEECARREALEETGIKVGNLSLMSVSNDIMYKQHWLTIGFIARHFEGEPELKEPEKFEEWKWFGIDNLPEPLFPPTRKMLENFMEKKIYDEGGESCPR